MSSKVHRFCSLDELEKARTITRWVDDMRDEITAIHADGRVIVVSSVCPHFGGEFDFLLECGELRCRWHGWRFDLENGSCLSYPVKTKVRHYEHRTTEEGFLEILYQ